MRHRNKTKILSRKAAPRKALYKNLASGIIIYEKVKTTKAKAKALRPYVEKLITKAGQGDLAARRYLISHLSEESAVAKAMDVLGPKYKTRNGGYLRIISLGTRQGDGAEMAMVEFV